MKAAAPGSRPAWLLPDWREAPASLRLLTTLRHGGVSVGPYAGFNLACHVGDDPAAVEANRAILRSGAALPAGPLWLQQVHGIDVVEHRGPLPALPPRADAAVAFEPGRVCVVMTADCLPVVFADRAGTRVGIAHAGWRGMVSGVLEATITALRCRPSELIAWLGPAIGQDAFEVGGEVRDAFLDKDPSNVTAFVPNAAGRFQADLYELARRTLASAGVRSVSGGGHCTSAETEQFFSFRRDGVRTGRMATLAWLAPETTRSA